MQDLTFAKPDDIFIFTRFTNPVFEGKQVLFAETVEEAIGYTRHIFLYDILNDVSDDIGFDFKVTFDSRQVDAISILNYWFKLGKIANSKNCNLEFSKFCKAFNCEFAHREEIEYEIQILKGAEKLRNFLTERYSGCENFDKKRLFSLCSKDLFAGKPLKDFLDLLF